MGITKGAQQHCHTTDVQCCARELNGWLLVFCEHASDIKFLLLAFETFPAELPSSFLIPHLPDLPGRIDSK
jgi:hypothetical protein